MGINVRALALAAGAIAVLLSLVTSTQADDTDDVRRAVMGHEAFIQRCIEGMIGDLADAANFDPATLTDRDMKFVKEQARKGCEAHYREVNVCMPGGTAKAINKIDRVMAKLEKILSDPLTRAQEYKSSQVVKIGLERELAALRDLMNGSTDYCDMESGE